MATTLDDLLALVTVQKTTVDGVLVLIGELVAAKNDPAKLQAIADGLAANTAALDTALKANAPA